MKKGATALAQGPEKRPIDNDGPIIYKDLGEWDQVPETLKEKPNWVLWRAEERDGKVTKIPYQPDGKPAASTRPQQWTGFNEVIEAFKTGLWSGIGFVLTGSGITGIDLDHCIGPDGKVADWAQEIVEGFSSYTELSPSGTGLHILVYGKLPEDKGRKKALDNEAGIEIYNSGRYLTVTGKRLPNMPGEVELRQEKIDELLKKYFDKPKEEPIQQPTNPIEEHNPPPRLTDGQVILKAKLSASGRKFDDLFNGSTLGYNGDDSAADMALMNMLAFWTGKNREQMERIFSMSGLGQREKWKSRADYRKMTIDKAIQDTSEVYTGPFESTDDCDDPEGLIERVRDNPKSLKDKAVLRALARLREDDPMEFDLTLKAIKSAIKGLRTETIIKMVDRAAKDEKAQVEEPTDEEIKRKAIAIATEGDPFKFLIWRAQMDHLGDINYQKVLIASIASANSTKSNGIQPGGSGEKGSGKSDACNAVYHLIPAKHKIDGSLSPMSLFYLRQAGKLEPGTILFSDDVEYMPILPVYKRSTGSFQKATRHITVSSGQNREVLELTIPPRIVWWLTSVESVASEQAFDRQFPISTDSSFAHKDQVADEIARRRARTRARFEEDEGAKIARAIIEDIYDNGPFRVVIPQAEKAKWVRRADFRGQEQFWDMVDALVILRWRQHKRDPDGWLIAEDRDLIEAKEIMEAHREVHTVDLTEAEMKIVETLAAKGVMTQADLTKELKIAQSTVSLRLKSILAKSAAIVEHVDGGCKTYELNPEFKGIIKGSRAVDLVKLGPNEAGEAYCSPQVPVLCPYCSVIGVPIAIKFNNSSIIPYSLLQYIEEYKGKNFSCPQNRGYESCRECLVSKNIFPLYSSGDDYNNVRNREQAASMDYNNDSIPIAINSKNDSSKSPTVPIPTTITMAGDVKEVILSGSSGPSTLPVVESEPDSPSSCGHELPPIRLPADDTLASRIKAADDRWAEHERFFSNKSNNWANIVYAPKGPAREYSLLAANLWMGCKNGCLYCYGPTLPGMNKEKYSIPTLKKDALERLEADLARFHKMGNREPILLMFAGDPYCPPNDDFSLSRRALELCRVYNHPFTVLTKNTVPARRDFDLYGPDDTFATTLTFLNPEKSKLWEPNADLPQDRIESLRIAHERGIMTWASIEPVIEPEESLAVIKAAAPYVDFFKIGKWNHDPDHRDDAIDWAKFKDDVEALLKSLGKEYMLKEDLVKAAELAAPSKTSLKDSKGFKEFKARMDKRKCVLCNRSFPYDLTRYDVGDKHGYVCTTCLMEGPPIKEDNSQTKLSMSA